MPMKVDMSSFVRGLIYGCLGALVFANAQAATYCTEANALPRRCIYDDARQCKSDAKVISGRCLVNTAAIKTKNGAEKFCMVLADGVARCLYSDAVQCERDATRNMGVCLNNVIPMKDKNPYRYELNNVN